MNLTKLIILSGVALSAGLLEGVAQPNRLSGVGGSDGLYSRNRYSSVDLGLDEQIKTKDMLTFGALSLHPRVEFLAVKEDNVFLSDEAQREDTYMVLSPGILARYGKSTKAYVYVDGTVDVPLGYSEDDEDIDNFQVTTMAHYDKSKSTVNARYSYRDIRSGDIIIGNRVTKEEHAVSGGYDHKLSRKTALGIQAAYDMHDYDSENYVDNTHLKLSGRVYWKAFDKTRLYGQVSMGEVDVDGNVDGFGDAEYQEVSLGSNTRLSSRWQVAGSVGYQVRQFDRDEIDDVEGITSSVRVQGHLFDYVKAGLGLWSLIQPAVNEAGATMMETRIEPTLSRRIWIDELVVSASMAWGWVNYDTPDTQDSIGEIETPLVFDDREDEYWGYTLGLDWQILDDLSAGGGYSYIENETNISVGEESTDYEAERWFFRARYNF